MSKLFKNCYFISYALSAQNATSLRMRQEKSKWFNFFISLTCNWITATPNSRDLYAVSLNKTIWHPFLPLGQNVKSFKILCFPNIKKNLTFTDIVEMTTGKPSVFCNLNETHFYLIIFCIDLFISLILLKSIKYVLILCIYIYTYYIYIYSRCIHI